MNKYNLIPYIKINQILKSIFSFINCKTFIVKLGYFIKKNPFQMVIRKFIDKYNSYN